MPSSKQKQQPRQWSTAVLTSDAEKAKSIFRNERLGEPLDLYKQFFQQFSTLFANLVDELDEVRKNPVDPELIAELVADGSRQKAFRYLTAPPISADDLATVADANLTPSQLRVNAAEAESVRDTILAILDPHRFPWVADNRKPGKHERHTAIVASAALAAASEVGTHRRKTAKTAQEQAVKDTLTECGFNETAVRDIPMLTAAPTPGTRSAVKPGWPALVLTSWRAFAMVA
jgi:hypothetical protein